MNRPEWIKKMISDGKKEDEIIDAIITGDKENGINPMEGKDARTFAKLNYKKVLKKINQ